MDNPTCLQHVMLCMEMFNTSKLGRIFLLDTHISLIGFELGVGTNDGLGVRPPW